MGGQAPIEKNKVKLGGDEKGASWLALAWLQKKHQSRVFLGLAPGV